MTVLELGGDGKNTVIPLDAPKFLLWTASADRSEFSCLGHLPWLSDLDSFAGMLWHTG